MKRQFFFIMLSLISSLGFGQEYSDSQRDLLSDTEKIVGLSKCWSEAKYNFVYFDRLNFDWDSLYQKTIPTILATRNDFEYFRELKRFVATLKDGHTQIWWNRPDLNEYWATIPIMTRLIDGKMIITKVLNNELQQSMGINEGLEIVQINGVDAHEYVSANIKPFVSASTEQWLNFIAYGREATRGKKSESLRLTFKDNNNKVFESVISRSMSENKLPPKPLFDFSLLKNNIGILKINDFLRDNFMETFDSIYDKILATDALIIDIRGNGGGNSNNSTYVLSHLTKESFKMSTWSSPSYIPAFASWKLPKEWYIGEPWIVQPVINKPYYNKQVVVLIDESTFSAAEDFCVGFRSMNRGIILGSPSGGSTGNPISFSLPGGGNLQLCTKKDTYPDGSEFVGVGILPDIKVCESVSSFFSKTRNGTDNSNATRKAVEVLKSNMKTK